MPRAFTFETVAELFLHSRGRNDAHRAHRLLVSPGGCAQGSKRILAEVVSRTFKDFSLSLSSYFPRLLLIYEHPSLASPRANELQTNFFSIRGLARLRRNAQEVYASDNYPNVRSANIAKIHQIT